MTDRSIVHAMFTVERSWKHAPERVFAAWANPAHKRQWFGSPEEGNADHIFDFREGGREYSASDMGGDRYTYDVSYRDIVANNRIVYTYEMTKNGERMSVSLATIELFAVGGGTRMVVREDGAFLDGLDTVDQREAGTNYLVDQLGAFLDRT